MEDEPELFLEFANLTELPETTPVVEGHIQAFANTFGPLRMWERFTDIKARRFIGNSFATWAIESRRMRHAVQLWNWTGRSSPDGKPDRNVLREAIVWRKETNPNTGKVVVDVEYRPPGEDSVHGVMSSVTPDGRHVLDTWRFGEHLRPARLWIAHTISRALVRDVTQGFVFTPDPNKPKPAVLSRSLRGCLWYQFYRAYMGEFKIARCLAPGCGGWMRYERTTKKMHLKCANRLRQRKRRATKR